MKLITPVNYEFCKTHLLFLPRFEVSVLCSQKIIKILDTNLWAQKHDPPPLKQAWLRL